MACLEAGIHPARISPGEPGYIARLDTDTEEEMRLCYRAARLADGGDDEHSIGYDEWVAKSLADNPDWNPPWL